MVKLMTVAETRIAPPADTARLSLLDRIGGPVAVDMVVVRLIDALTNDPCLAARFEGVDVSRLCRAQRRFFVEAFGGAANTGGTTTLARVDGEDLVRIVIHLHDVLDSLALPEPLVEQLLLAVAAKVLADGDGARSR